MRVITGIALCAVSVAATAANNDLDGTFGSGGMVRIGKPPSSTATFQLLGATLRSDGKIIVAGIDQSTVPSPAAVGLLNSDGSWDTGFGDHGLVTISYSNPRNAARFEKIQIFSDGSILAVGGLGFPNSVLGNPTCTLLAKLDATGAPINAFGPNGNGVFCFDFAADAGHGGFHFADVAMDSDDTFFLTSLHTNLSGGAVAHFDANGALIPSYGTDGIAALPSNAFADLLALRGDHSILAVGIGVVDAATNTENLFSASLSSGGVLAAGYGTGGVFAFDQASQHFTGPTSAALDNAGNLILSDNDSPANGGSEQPYRIARLTPQGALDTSFNGSGQQPGAPGFATLSVSGVPSQDFAIAARPLADGHIFVVGGAGAVNASDGSTNIALLRLEHDAAYDVGFGDASHPGWASINPGGSSNSTAYVRALTSDDQGRLFVVGSASDALGSGCNFVLRLIPDRLFDDGFDNPVSFPNCH